MGHGVRADARHFRMRHPAAGVCASCLRRIRRMIDATLDAAIARRLAALLAPPRNRQWPLRIDGTVAGLIAPERAARLARFDAVFVVAADEVAFAPSLDSSEARSEALARVTRTLATEGALSPWRDERYAVGPALDAPPWFLLERAAARYFGIHSWAVHGNGLVADGSELRIWFARRSPTKAIDPDMLDSLVGGGVPAGFRLRDAFVKEAWEEAGLPDAVARAAKPVGTLPIVRDTDGGLFRESIVVYDIALNRDDIPANQDGEAVEHRCVPLSEAARLIALTEGADQVTPEASLVVLDALVRHGAVDPEGAAARVLRSMRATPSVTRY